MWNGQLGVRRLLELVGGLPTDTQLRAELGGYDADAGPWTEQLELLAQLVEVCSVSATERHRLTKPRTVPRRGLERDRPAGGQRVEDARPAADAARAMLAGRHLAVVS